MTTDVVLDALEQALYARQPERDRIIVAHFNRGSQYIPALQRAASRGRCRAVGRQQGRQLRQRPDETINGLYKAELIHRRASWKTKESLELATLEWVSWFNHHRLLDPIGYIPPAEADANYYGHLAEQAAAA